MKMRALVLMGAVAIALALLCPPVSAQVTTPGLPLVPLGYCQLTSVDAAVGLSACPGGIPTGANVVVFEAEAQAIRYRDDGASPTAAVGMPAAVGATVVYPGTISNLRVISQTAGAKLNALFYRAP